MRQQMLFRHAIVCACLILTSSTTILHAGFAGPARVLANIAASTGAFDVNDYHITISNPGGFDKLKVNEKPGGFNDYGFPIVEKTLIDRTTMRIEFSGKEHRAGASPKSFIDFQSDVNQIRIPNSPTDPNDGSYFTYNREPVLEVKFPGFRVVGDPQFTLFNDFDTPMGIRKLQFLNNVPELFNFGGLIPGDAPGFGLPISDFILPALSSFTFTVDGDISPGNFLFAQFKVYDPTDPSVETGAVIYGHQAHVPEPSTVTMIAIGGAILLGRVARRRRVV